MEIVHVLLINVEQHRNGVLPMETYYQFELKCGWLLVKNY